MTKQHSSGETVPISGIYSVVHREHRLPHEVTLLEGQRFPACSKCGVEVRFAIARPVDGTQDTRGRILLYKLTELGADSPEGFGTPEHNSEDEQQLTKETKRRGQAKAHKKGKL